jgi:tripeptidyl-peptidase-1
MFLEAYRPGVPRNTTFKFATIDDGMDSQNKDSSEDLGGEESNIDTQWSVGIATAVPITFLSVGFGGNTKFSEGAGAFIDTAQYVLSMNESERPNVLSTSYGFDEGDLDPSLMR